MYDRNFWLPSFPSSLPFSHALLFVILSLFPFPAALPFPLLLGGWGNAVRLSPLVKLGALSAGNHVAILVALILKSYF